MSSTQKVVLYSYYRSSCTWRVRIALALKEIDHQMKYINVIMSEQLTEEFKSISPSGYIPVLIIDGQNLTESVAILEYLEETRSTGKRLLPTDPLLRAKVRAIVLTIVSGIQPLQNTIVLNQFPEPTRRNEWAQTWVNKGFKSLEQVLTSTAGQYCVGNDVTMADLCLVPQVYNAKRFNVDMSQYPVISRINDNLMSLDAFKSTHPDRQGDCPNKY